MPIHHRYCHFLDQIYVKMKNYAEGKASFDEGKIVISKNYVGWDEMIKFHL